MILNDIQKRLFLFLGICIPVRLIAMFIALYIHKKYLPILGVPYLIAGIGIIYIYITGARQNGAETMGQPIWWNGLRPAHGLIYLVFAISAFLKYKDSWMILLIDVLLGLTAFWTYHISVGNIRNILG